ncbi:MAG TPA: hypothetical protein VHY84_24090 [Bryobacteraceae bacterium]|nr:hypothetical protein [Bryobacteraceae bacterium]
MPQPLNWKNSDARITQTIEFIGNMGDSQRYRDVVTALNQWNTGQPQVAIVSAGMHQGFHVEFVHKTATNERLGKYRKYRRSIILMRVVILGETVAAAQAATSRVADGNLEYQAKSLVGDCATSLLLRAANPATPSWRMLMSGLMNPNNRTEAFFGRQDRVHAHCLNQVAPTIVNAVTREVYLKALGSVGRTLWGQSSNSPGTRGRFDRFDQTEDGTRLEMNCWEGVLFWAVKGRGFTVAACRRLYDRSLPGTENAILRQFFGTERVFDRLTAQPGDVLTWVSNGVLNHVALYMGLGPLTDPDPQIEHNLSLDTAVERIEGGQGTAHFVTEPAMGIRYERTYTVGICYSNTPFWDATGNTPQYQFAQQLV